MTEKEAFVKELTDYLVKRGGKEAESRQLAVRFWFYFSTSDEICDELKRGQ